MRTPTAAANTCCYYYYYYYNNNYRIRYNITIIIVVRDGVTLGDGRAGFKIFLVEIEIQILLDSYVITIYPHDIDYNSVHINSKYYYIF